MPGFNINRDKAKTAYPYGISFTNKRYNEPPYSVKNCSKSTRHHTRPSAMIKSRYYIYRHHGTPRCAIIASLGAIHLERTQNFPKN